MRAIPPRCPMTSIMLLALIAPRRLFLGNARRDVWSDPNSSFRAAQAASAMWTAMGAAGISGEDMRSFDPTDGIVWWLRPGGHSIVDDDVLAFIEFLKVRPAAGAAQVPTAAVLPIAETPR